MSRQLFSRAAPHDVNASLALLSRDMAAPIRNEVVVHDDSVSVGQAVDGSTLGGTVVLDSNGNPVAVHVGPETPSYAKPLLFVGGNKYPAAVAASSILGGIAGYLFGGPLWALGALLASNLAGRAGASYVCGQADKAGNAGCDQAAAWGTSPAAF